LNRSPCHRPPIDYRERWSIKYPDRSQLTEAFIKNGGVIDEATIPAFRAELNRVLIGVSYFGELLKCELIGMKDLGGVVREYCYLIQWDRKPVILYVRAYRPKEDWVLAGFRTFDDPPSIYSIGAIQSPKQVGEPQTATKSNAKAELR
jgi:hypothetical protein